MINYADSIKCCFAVLISTLALGGSAYAQQAAAPGVTQPAVPTSTPAAPVAAATASTPATTPAATSAPSGLASANRPSPAAIKEARNAGYIMKTKSGNYFFCKEDADVGTRLASEHCVDADALALTLQRQQLDRDALKNSRTGTSSR